MRKHTPGPWEISDQYIRPDYRDDKVICQWGSYSSEADAHLIAAAPDLLAALKAITNLYRQPHREEWPDPAQFEEAKAVAAQARAAIAKAEAVS